MFISSRVQITKVTLFATSPLKGDFSLKTLIGEVK